MQNTKQNFRKAKCMATSIAVAVALSAFASSAQAAGKNGSSASSSDTFADCMAKAQSGRSNKMTGATGPTMRDCKDSQRPQAKPTGLKHG